jgi:IS4 transposase
MVMTEILQRAVEGSPVTVMARMVMEEVLDARWVDEVFETQSQRQYTRKLLFSTVVDLMTMVALGLRPSLHAAAQANGRLAVSLSALYAKIAGIEPAVLRAMVKQGGERLAPVMQQLRGGRTPLVAHCQVLPFDGNQLAATDRRLAPLRQLQAVALPGKAVVVYDPELDLVLDMEPCQDAYVQERRLVDALVQQAKPGQLWIGDANFSTRPVMDGLDRRGAWFVIREHGANPNPTPLGLMVPVGRTDTGRVSEQPVQLTMDDGRVLVLRRIELVLDTPTRNKTESIRLLTNAPADKLGPCGAAQLYRKRWSIESMFQRLESVLHSEVSSLGYPSAALLAFTVAVLAYNVLSVLQAALEASHELDRQGLQVSLYYVADEVRSHYEGLMLLIPPADWDSLLGWQSPAELAQLLRTVAAYARPQRFRKHPRGPKNKPRAGPALEPVPGGHVATARMLRKNPPG